MNAIKNIVVRLNALGITIYLKDGKLKTRSLPGAINDEVKNLIGKNKEDLIYFLEQSEESQLALDVIPKRNQNITVLPLSFTQQRLWLIDRMKGSSTEYNMPIKLRIKGHFDVERAQSAIVKIIERHETLRTIFCEVNGEPVQEIKDSFSFELPIIDLCDMSCELREYQIETLIQDNSQIVFDLSKDLPIRACFIAIEASNSEFVDGLLLLCIHHIAGDGWSLGLLIEEFRHFYQSNNCSDLIPIDALQIQYADFALWQREWMLGNAFKRQQQYWLSHLQDAPTLHQLPLDSSRPKLKQYKGGKIDTKLDASLAKALKLVATKYRVT